MMPEQWSVLHIPRRSASDNTCYSIAMGPAISAEIIDHIDV